MAFFDALRVKIRDEGMVKNKAIYVALAFNPDGEKEVLGLRIAQSGGAKFWLKVINDLKPRGTRCSCHVGNIAQSAILPEFKLDARSGG